VTYCGHNYQIEPVNCIKINGVYFNANRRQMADENYKHMRDKMERHFRDWSRRSLSILGNIQILKTFGISQYLYALAAIDLEEDHWKELRKLMYKFIWTKNYNAPPAPHRIKMNVMHEKICNGGFGMLDIQEITRATRLKRVATLVSNELHPVADLQRTLGVEAHLKHKAIMRIDDVTDDVVWHINKQHRTAYNSITDIEATADLVLNTKLLHCCVADMVRPDRYGSIEFLRLRRDGVLRLHYKELIPRQNELTTLLRICYPEIVRHLTMLKNLYSGQEPMPDANGAIYIFNRSTKAWQRCNSLTSRAIRELSTNSHCLNSTKLFNVTRENAQLLYTKVNKLRNIQNKTKLLRLIHGDVYCGTRLVRFGLSDNDRCVRCFQPETINHLLYECPYSAQVWEQLGVGHTNAMDIIHGQLTQMELEIIAELINQLVFRKLVLDTRVLVEVTLMKFERGLSRTNGIAQRASDMLTRLRMAHLPIPGT
jgi:hypothetical protein